MESVMSINILSGKYNAVSTASQAINNAIIAFKKKALLEKEEEAIKYPNLKVTESELANAKAHLVSFLEELQRAISKTTIEGNVMPPEIFAVYVKKIEDNEEIKNQLPILIEALKNNKTVSKDGFNALDILISDLDNQRSVWFKQLRILRG